MIVLSFRFPARRYHATPWDAHVNEGRIEWPPSCWRLMRAMLAVGYTKFGWVDEPPSVAQDLIGKLAAVEPAYALPSSTESHTRHYMPTRKKPVKVFDSFLRFVHDNAELAVRFDTELSPDETDCLRELVSGLTYLGRAESWVEVSLLDAEHATLTVEQRHWCRPNDRSPDEHSPGRPVRLLAAQPESVFQAWRTESIECAFQAVEQQEQDKQRAKGKSVTAAAAKKLRAKVEATYPTNILHALQLETHSWQSQGWPKPPGSRWVEYSIPDESFQQKPLAPLALSPKQDRVSAVLLAVDGNGKHGTVRPLMRHNLRLMELLHSTAIYKATSDLGFGNIPELSGKDNDGNVLRGHQHAHYLPLCLLGGGKIDHVLVWCRSGFTNRAIASLAAIRWAYSKGNLDLSINMAGMGEVADIRQQLDLSGSTKMNSLNSLVTAASWQSATPLVLRKYQHKRGKKTPEGQIREELVQRGFDEPTDVCIWTPQKMVERKLKGFVLRRKSGKQQPPSETSWAASIRFARPQAGPICLGYASHFGMGLFQAEES